MRKAYPNPSETLCKILALLKFKNQCPTFVTGQNKLMNRNFTRLKISIYFWLYKTLFFFRLAKTCEQFFCQLEAVAPQPAGALSGIPWGHICSLGEAGSIPRHWCQVAGSSSSLCSHCHQGWVLGSPGCQTTPVMSEESSSWNGRIFFFKLWFFFPPGKSLTGGENPDML